MAMFDKRESNGSEAPEPTMCGAMVTTSVTVKFELKFSYDKCSAWPRDQECRHRSWKDIAVFFLASQPQRTEASWESSLDLA